MVKSNQTNREGDPTDRSQSSWSFLLSVFFDLAFLAFGFFYSPIFVSKMGQAADKRALLAERLGSFSKGWAEKIKGRRILWVHAVSVGEVMAARLFLEGFLKACHGWHVVLTTVTPTGQKIAKQLESERVSVCYFPFDISFVVRKFFCVLRPECLLLFETELWPNLLTEASRFSVPVGIMNARLSPRSYRWYRRFGYFFRSLFGKLDFVLAQTRDDGKRFMAVGALEDRIKVLGNIKFDQVSLTVADDSASLSLRREWHFEPYDRIWIAGSTHPGEEEKLLCVFSELREKYQFLKLLIAPRHIERSHQLVQKIRKRHLQVRLATDKGRQEPFDVLILNQLGVLKYLYAVADVVFVGGSFVHRGGQNPIEPACFRKPILHGPHTFNFERIYKILDREGGALLVKDEEQLQLAVRRLLDNETERETVGKRAFATVEKLQGATKRHIDWVLDFLSPASKERIHNVQLNAKLFSPTGGGN